MARTPSSRRRRPTRSGGKSHDITWRSFILSVLLLAAVTAGLLLVLRKTDYTPFSEKCVSQVEAVLKQNRVAIGHLESTRLKTETTWRTTVTCSEKEFKLPAAADLERLPKVLEKAPELAEFTLAKISRRKDSKRRELILEFRYAKIPVYRVIWWQLLAPPARGKLAIVLDDWGYSKPVFTASLSLPGEVTYAILPNLPFSREISETLSRKGKEFILHLPMEPQNTTAEKLEKNTLLTSMSPAQLTDITRRDIASLPHLKGVNNHMGSEATAQCTTMEPVLAEIKRQGLYFLDSMTSDSVCNDVAARLGIPFLKRDVFIDNENNRGAIVRQLEKARDLAIANGEAIAIGHARSLTIDVLKEMMPQLSSQGIILVRASDLLNN